MDSSRLKRASHPHQYHLVILARQPRCEAAPALRGSSHARTAPRWRPLRRRPTQRKTRHAQRRVLLDPRRRRNPRPGRPQSRVTVTEARTSDLLRKASPQVAELPANRGRIREPIRPEWNKPATSSSNHLRSGNHSSLIAIPASPGEGWLLLVCRDTQGLSMARHLDSPSTGDALQLGPHEQPLFRGEHPSFIP